jgi:hypothetical protein
VFVRKDGVWEEEAVLMPPAPAALPSGGHAFGRSVAISGSTLIVGAPGHDVDLRHLGSVFVFVRSHTGLTPQWMLQQTLVSPKPWPTHLLPGGNRFGYSVAVAGDMAIVGEPIDMEIRTEPYYTPSAHVFVWDGSTWTLEETLGGATSTDFGCSVALSGSIAIVGARADQLGGAAYVFVRSHTGLVPLWMQQAALTASDGQWTDWFGSSVAIEGDLALVGAPAFEPGMGGTPSGRAGAAYVFAREGSDWTEVDKIKASDGVADDRFGNAVAITNGTLTVGVPHSETSSRSGSVYRFGRAHTGSAPLWFERLKFSPFDGAGGDQFGHSLAISSNTMLVGAPSEDERGSNAGAVYGFRRSDLLATVGNVDGPGGVRGLLQVFRTPLSVDAAPAGSVMAGEGTSFHGVRLVGPLGLGPDNWIRAVLVAVTRPGESYLPPIHCVRVYDLSDPDTPALVSTGEISAPSSPLPEEDPSRHVPAIDVVETGPEAFRVYALAPHDADQTGLYAFDFGPTSPDFMPPITMIRFDGRAKDVRVLQDGLRARRPAARRPHRRRPRKRCAAPARRVRSRHGGPRPYRVGDPRAGCSVPDEQSRLRG